MEEMESESKELNDRQILEELQWERQKGELLRVLQENEGAGLLLQRAYGMMGNPLTLCDTSFSVMERYPVAEKEDFELYRGKLYMKTEAVAAMQREGVVAKLYQAEHAFLTHRREPDVVMMYCPVRIRQNMVGYLCSSALEHPFQEKDQELMEFLAGMVSLEMQKSSFFTERAGMKYEYFLADLVEGTMPDEAYIRTRFRQLGRQDREYFWVMVLAVEAQRQLPVNAGYFLEQMLALLPNTMAFLYQGMFVAVRSTAWCRPFTETEEIKLSEFLRMNHMRLTVSNGCRNLMWMPQYYRQAQELLQLALHREMDKRILLYEEYQVETMAETHLNDLACRAMVHPDLYVLKEYDQAHRTEYLDTLRIYLAQNRNAVKSAAQLHIHKSTFFYRLGKITEILGMEWETAGKLFSYELSFRLGREELSVGN
ncbi:MAG: PucR family transcriptional regulator [Lachnospiraceae bacterium]|nr:PucR family transcriptional regulator [Lachnospiraceae bacterium]